MAGGRLRSSEGKSRTDAGRTCKLHTRNRRATFSLRGNGANRHPPQVREGCRRLAAFGAEREVQSEKNIFEKQTDELTGAAKTRAATRKRLCQITKCLFDRQSSTVTPLYLRSRLKTALSELKDSGEAAFTFVDKKTGGFLWYIGNHISIDWRRRF